MSDHYHYEYAEARHDHRGDYAGERHDHDLDYAGKHHRHHDLECEDERLKILLSQWQAGLRQLRTDLETALGRIRQLERLQPTCVICLDATATQQTIRGPACSDCVGEDQDHEPEPVEYDPGPEVDDEGGMSEYRYVLPEDYERGQS